MSDDLEEKDDIEENIEIEEIEEVGESDDIEKIVDSEGVDVSPRQPGWVTPVLAIAMLVIGMLAGYFANPLINQELAEPEVVEVNNPPAANPSNAPG